jgi:DivIVA domain-containing protein
MPLTPEGVRNKLFTTVRLREGYDQTEVDEFLDEVEAELARLIAENSDLRARLEAATRGEPVEPLPTPEPEPEPMAEVAPEPVAEPAPPAAPQIVVRSAEEVGEAAARLLAMAQRTADETVAEARTDAERMVSEAHETAERVTTEAQSRADQLDRDSRARSDAQEAELAAERTRVLGKLEEERARLQTEVEDLKAFEREYRARLRSFLEGQLHQLETRGADDTPLAPPAAGSAPASSGASAGDRPAPPQGALGRILAEEENAQDGDEL